MPIARTSHLALKVSDREAATRFYENVFGFRQGSSGALARACFAALNGWLRRPRANEL